jgi:CBS domain containing-hemolysin-like protein
VTALGLLAILGLVLANAYFVATEFALVAVRRSQVQLWVAEGRRGAAAASRAIQHLDDAIAATQLGITLASIGLGFLGEPALARVLAPPLAAAGLGSLVAVHGLAVVVAFSIVTFLHVVVGELAPKALALDRPGEVALACARPLLVFARVFRPVLVVMNGAGNALVRGLGVRPAGQSGRVHSPQELQLLVSEAGREGRIRSDAARMLDNVFRMSQKRVRDVMVPRERVLAVPRTIREQDLLDLILEEGYTRLPVYDGGLDKVVGVLHTKDLLHLFAQKHVVVLADAIRPHDEISPDLSIADALRRFRREHRHLAVVREPEGPLLGIVTLEDVLEAIVGEIEDEHDPPPPKEPLEEYPRQAGAALTPRGTAPERSKP